MQVKLSALKEKVISVRREEGPDNGTWIASTTIDGAAGAPLRAVHVEMAKGWVPTVSYVELFSDTGYELVRCGTLASGLVQCVVLVLVRCGILAC